MAIDGFLRIKLTFMPLFGSYNSVEKCLSFTIDKSVKFDYNVPVRT